MGPIQHSNVSRSCSSCNQCILFNIKYLIYINQLTSIIMLQNKRVTHELKRTGVQAQRDSRCIVHLARFFFDITSTLSYLPMESTIQCGSTCLHYLHTWFRIYSLEGWTMLTAQYVLTLCTLWKSEQAPIGFSKGVNWISSPIAVCS